jgi:hypothetical protein
MPASSMRVHERVYRSDIGRAQSLQEQSQRFTNLTSVTKGERDDYDDDCKREDQ